MDGKDCLTNPFAIVTDYHKHCKMDTTGTTPPKPTLTLASKGEIASPSQTGHPSEPAANLFATSCCTPSNTQHGSKGTGAISDTFGNSNPAKDTRSHDHQKESLKMPQMQNPHENGLHRWTICRSF